MHEQDESKLKKEFREKDVNRLRNIVTKKFGAATVNQVGYTKTEEVHKEGDIWEDNDKKWTIQGGIRQTYSKLNNVKKALKIPFFCPNCKNPMNHRLDKMMYDIHTKCFDCVIKMESRLRLEGKYEEYAYNIQTNNIFSFIDDAKGFVRSFTKESDDMYSENGDKQDFVGGHNKALLADKWLKELEEFENKIKDIQDEKPNADI